MVALLAVKSVRACDTRFRSPRWRARRKAPYAASNALRTGSSIPPSSRSSRRLEARLRRCRRGRPIPRRLLAPAEDERGARDVAGALLHARPRRRADDRRSTHSTPAAAHPRRRGGVSAKRIFTKKNGSFQATEVSQPTERAQARFRRASQQKPACSRRHRHIVILRLTPCAARRAALRPPRRRPAERRARRRRRRGQTRRDPTRVFDKKLEPPASTDAPRAEGRATWTHLEQHVTGAKTSRWFSARSNAFVSPSDRRRSRRLASSASARASQPPMRAFSQKTSRAAPSSSVVALLSPRLAFAVARRCRETCLSWPFAVALRVDRLLLRGSSLPGVSDRAPLPGSSLEADASTSAPGVGDGAVAPGTSWRASPLSPSRVDSVDVADVAETTDRDRGRRPLRALTRGVPDDSVDDDEP